MRNYALAGDSPSALSSARRFKTRRATKARPRTELWAVDWCQMARHRTRVSRATKTCLRKTYRWAKKVERQLSSSSSARSSKTCCGAKSSGTCLRGRWSDGPNRTCLGASRAALVPRAMFVVLEQVEQHLSRAGIVVTLELRRRAPRTLVLEQVQRHLPRVGIALTTRPSSAHSSTSERAPVPRNTCSTLSTASFSRRRARAGSRV